VFAADFASFDMTDLVSQQASQSRIRDAETHARKATASRPSRCCRKALDDLLDDYANRKRTRYNKSAFDFAPDTLFSDFDLNEIRGSFVTQRRSFALACAYAAS
jgi:hypothetical protein